MQKELTLPALNSPTPGPIVCEVALWNIDICDRRGARITFRCMVPPSVADKGES